MIRFPAWVVTAPVILSSFPALSCLVLSATKDIRSEVFENKVLTGKDFTQCGTIQIIEMIVSSLNWPMCYVRWDRNQFPRCDSQRVEVLSSQSQGS